MTKKTRVLSMREYVEFFLKEHKVLSGFDLAMLIHKHSDSKFLLTKKPRSTQLYISTILTKLKKEGKIIKLVKDRKWEWVEEPNKHSEQIVNSDNNHLV